MDSEPSSAAQARRRSKSLLQQVSFPPASTSTRAEPVHEMSDETDAHSHREDTSEPSSSDWEMDEMQSDEGLTDDEETGLTEGDKGKRKRRRRKNTMLDQRIMTEDVIKKEEEKIATQHVIKTTLINGLLIALWYLFSISISVVSPLIHLAPNYCTDHL